jgi:hypothetical protein
LEGLGIHSSITLFMPLKNCICLATVFLLGFNSFAQSSADKQSISIHSLSDELNSFYNPEKLPAYLEGTVAQFSSYDTTGGNDDGFNGRFSYLKKYSDGSLLLADLNGPGVINRIWTPTPTTDTLDFYIDNNEKPALSISFIDLFSGKQFPFVSPLCGNQLGGYYCYFPILFQKSCRIVDRGKKIQFHQIQYRLFPSHVKVSAFNIALTAEEKAILDKIASLWKMSTRTCLDFYPKSTESVLANKITATLNPGDTNQIYYSDKGGRIVGIEFSWIGPNTWNKNIDIRISWDDDSYPAVYCPIEDFFGFSYGEPSMQSLLLGTTANSAYCYFPMPFDNHAQIELIYRTGPGDLSEVPIKATIYKSAKIRNKEREGKFYAVWNSHSYSSGDGPHVFLNTTGKGHYVGSILQARGLHLGMTYFFEGDDSTAIDGKMKIHGTGSEDYFNGGWYALLDRWDTRMSLPIHGALDYSLPFCRTGGYRLYLNDKISFEKSIFQSIEHGPVNNSIPAAYTSVALYYCDKGPGSVLIPDNELTKIVIPDTLIIYPQLMQSIMEGDIHLKTTWGAFNTGGLSYIYTVSGEAAISISLKEIPKGNYKILLDYVRSPHGCMFSVWNRQTQLSPWIDATSETRKRIDGEHIGDIQLTDLAKTISIRFKTADQHQEMMINRIILVKQAE